VVGNVYISVTVLVKKYINLEEKVEKESMWQNTLDLKIRLIL